MHGIETPVAIVIVEIGVERLPVHSPIWETPCPSPGLAPLRSRRWAVACSKSCPRNRSREIIMEQVAIHRDVVIL